jgi:hypothetical protein
MRGFVRGEHVGEKDLLARIAHDGGAFARIKIGKRGKIHKPWEALAKRGGNGRNRECLERGRPEKTGIEVDGGSNVVGDGFQSR